MNQPDRSGASEDEQAKLDGEYRAGLDPYQRPERLAKGGDAKQIDCGGL